MNKRHYLQFLYTDAEELLACGFVGDGGVGGGGYFFEVGGDSVLVGVDFDGDFGFVP